jgi:hypothetical protein
MIVCYDMKLFARVSIPSAASDKSKIDIYIRKIPPFAGGDAGETNELFLK